LTKAARAPAILSLCSIIFFASLILIVYFFFDNTYALAPELQYNKSLNTITDEGNPASAISGPTIFDPDLKVETVFRGIKFPTSMAFLGPNDILVLEKNEGKVQRIINGNMLSEPLLDVDVDNRGERGMLGIAVSKGDPKHAYVFLFYTEALEEYHNYCHSFTTPVDGPCVKGSRIDPLGNRVYRYELASGSGYELVNDYKLTLVNPKLLLDLPINPGVGKIGGVTVIGPDSNVYLVIGDIRIKDTKQDEPRFDGRSGILRVTGDGQSVNGGEKGPGNIIGEEHPLDKYFAYGIRNSFGMDFDPISGNLWDTENGLANGDEINLVEPGFNSGWPEVQGLASIENSFREYDLQDFGGRGKYSDPEFVWNETVAVTSLKFLDSDKLGKEYDNDMFVGDFKYGNLYHFNLNNSRTELSLEEPLNDRTADNTSELKNIILGEGFGGIVDIEVGPEGYLYLLSIEKVQGGGNPCRPERFSPTCVSYSSPIEGTIFRVLPATDISKVKGKNGE
jgi:aldose sugar dehydrogenase